MKSVDLTIQGRVISKKNSKRIVRAGTRLIPITSKAYGQFRELALWQLKTCKERFTSAVDVILTFQLKGQLNADLDNLVTSVADVLQDAGIIENDVQIVSITAKKHLGFGDWNTHITIKEAEDVHAKA